MLTKKKKLTKKEIKQDKLVESYYKAYSFFQNNRQRIAMFGGILVVIIFVAIFYINNKKQNNQTAGIELSRIMTLYNNGSYLEAINGRPGTPIIGLKKIVEEYGSTENGETAKIYLGNAYTYLGKTEEAYNSYQDYSGSLQLYQASSYAGQAAYFAEKKEFDKAADLYQKAAHVTETDVQNADYLVKAAINLMKSGDNKSAKEIFEKVQRDYKTSTAAGDIQKYLVQLN